VAVAAREAELESQVCILWKGGAVRVGGGKGGYHVCRRQHCVVRAPTQKGTGGRTGVTGKSTGVTGGKDPCYPPTPWSCVLHAGIASC
jgi:hypothetical protein